MQRGEKGLRGTLEIYNFISSYLLLTQRDPISIHRQRDSREDALWSSRWSIKGEKLKKGKCGARPPIRISARAFQSPGTASSSRRSSLWPDGRLRTWKWIILAPPDVHVPGIQIGETWGGEQWVWMDSVQAGIHPGQVTTAIIESHSKGREDQPKMLLVDCEFWNSVCSKEWKL